jgi:hypothetical protein
VCGINDPGHTSVEYLVLFAKLGMTNLIMVKEAIKLEICHELGVQGYLP